jgi:hypothetical protein
MTYPATGPNTTARPIRPTDADAMILRLFRCRFHPATIHTLYGAIVAQARRSEFYEEIGAADTVEGRFDMIVLHLVLVLRRIEREPQGAALGRALVDAFGRDMDHNLREIVTHLSLSYLFMLRTRPLLNRPNQPSDFHFVTFFVTFGHDPVPSQCPRRALRHISLSSECRRD